MVPQINYLAVVASMVVGFVFYHPAVLGRRWMALAGHTDSAPAGGSPLVYPVVAAASFVTAWVLAGCADISHEFYGGSFLSSALFTAWILWAGFTAARLLVHDLFDTRPRMLTVLNAAHELLTVTAMGLVIGLLAP